MSDIDKDKARRPSFMVKQDEKTKSGKEKKKNLEDLKKEIVMNDHKMKLDELVKQYETHIDNGLTTAKHKELLEKCPNAILFHHVGEGGCGMEINNYLETFKKHI